MAGYIYAIINKENGKQYIGSTNSFKTRKNCHLYLLRNGHHHNFYLQNAWNKYGKECFNFIVLEEHVTIPRKELYDIEQQYLDKYSPEYNTAKKVLCPSNGISMRRVNKVKNILDTFNVEYTTEEILYNYDDIENYFCILLEEGRIYPSEYFKMLEHMTTRPIYKIVEDDIDYSENDLCYTILTEKCNECQFANFEINLCNINDLKNKFCPNEHTYR